MGASDTNGRWAGIERPYTQDDIERIRGRFHVEHTLARLGAERSGSSSTPRSTSPRSAR